MKRLLLAAFATAVASATWAQHEHPSAGGHMHDYGRRLVLENVTREETIATLDSSLDPQGRILSMPIKTLLTPPAPHKNAGKAQPEGYKLDRGKLVRVTATYENTTGHSLPEGAMGIVVG